MRMIYLKYLLALRNIKRAFGNDVIDIRTVQRWFQRFRSGNENVKNEPRGRLKPAVRDNELKNLIKQN